MNFSDFYSKPVDNRCMRVKSFMKNPVLAVGILFTVIFLFQLKEKGYFSDLAEKRTPSSCKALRVKLDRRIPSTWKTSCEGDLYNNLAVDIPFLIEDKQWPKNPTEIDRLHFRELANFMIRIAKNSPEDNLERTDIIRVRMISEKMTINAVTEGRFMIKLATLTDAKLIAEHFKGTVQVQKIPKK